MSRYIRILNSIKANIEHLELTSGQSSSLQRIDQRLAYFGVVNLCGLPGVGKTVVGWLLASRGATYITAPSRVDEQDFNGASLVFVDNAEGERSQFRKLTTQLELRGAQKVVIVTRRPADEYVFRVSINLTEDDVSLVRSNIARLGYSVRKGKCPTLWHLLLPIGEGEP